MEIEKRNKRRQSALNVRIPISRDHAICIPIKQNDHPTVPENLGPRHSTRCGGQLSLARALRVTSAKYWLKLGEADEAPRELEALPGRAWDHHAAVRVRVAALEVLDERTRIISRSSKQARVAVGLTDRWPVLFLVVNAIRLFRCSILIVTLLLGFGFPTRVHGKPPSSPSTGLLREALTSLAQADHDYQGHRAEAMKQIHLAIEELTGKAGVRRQAAIQARHPAIRTAAKLHEPQATSDAQLRAAEGLLQQASTGLSGLPLEHVSAAIAQLNIALTIR